MVIITTSPKCLLQIWLINKVLLHLLLSLERILDKLPEELIKGLQIILIRLLFLGKCRMNLQLLKWEKMKVRELKVRMRKKRKRKEGKTKRKRRRPHR